MEQGFAASASPGSAGATVPGCACSRRQSRAAAHACAGHFAGGGACRRTRSDAAPPCRRHRWRLPQRRTAHTKSVVFPCQLKAGPHRRRGFTLCRAVGLSTRFCRRHCFQCQVPDSVCLVRILLCSPASFCSIRESYGDFCISSGSSRRAACDEPSARC